MAAVVAVVMLGSCTHNNGDIGDWFGTWRVTSIEVDNQPVENYGGGLFWMFQNDLICLSYTTEGMYHNYSRCWGRWAEEGNTLTFDFSYTSTEDEYKSYYEPQKESYFIDGVNRMTMTERKSNSMTLQMLRYNSDGSESVIVYKIHKQ